MRMAETREKMTGAVARGLWRRVGGGAGLAAVMLLAGPATAGTVGFTSFIDNETPSATYEVTVDDMVSPGFFQVTASVAGGSPLTADITGLGLDFMPSGDASVEYAASDFQSVSGGPVTDVRFNGTKFTGPGSGQVNFNGATSEDFDVLLAIGDAGIGGGDDFQTTTFKFPTPTPANGIAISLSDWTRVGVRGQSVGEPGGPLEESDKAISSEPETPPTVVPLPASAWAGLALLSLVGLERGRRRAVRGRA